MNCYFHCVSTHRTPPPGVSFASFLVGGSRQYLRAHQECQTPLLISVSRMQASYLWWVWANLQPQILDPSTHSKYWYCLGIVCKASNFLPCGRFTCLRLCTPLNCLWSPGLVQTSQFICLCPLPQMHSASVVPGWYISSIEIQTGAKYRYVYSTTPSLVMTVSVTNTWVSVKHE